MNTRKFRSLVDRLEVVGTAAAIVALIAFLALALQNLAQMGETSPRDRTVEAVLALTAAQYQAQQLVLNSTVGDAHATRQQWRVVERGLESVVALPLMGAASFLSVDISLWREEMEAEMRALSRGAISIEDAAPTIVTRSAKLVFFLRRAVDDVLLYTDRLQFNQRRAYQTIILGVLISCAGALLCGAFLIMRLVQSLHRARGAESSLRLHFDKLEETVRQRTKDLETAEAQLRDAIHTAPDGFAAFDHRGGLIVANQTAQALLPDVRRLLAPAATPEEGSAFGDFVFPTTGEVEGGSMRTAELELVNGTWLMVTLRRSTDGTAVMRLADVTPYKRAAKALETALYREQNLRRLYGDFVGIVSHQFRTPLAIIDSGAQKILRHGRGAPWDEIVERVGQIRSATNGLLQLIDATLDSKGLENGEMAFSPANIDLNVLLAALGEQLDEVYANYSLRWSLDLPAVFYGDPLLIEHAVSNLISNAAKFSPVGSNIVVVARALNRSIQISVRDEGVGIPSNEVDRIFESAYRAQNASKITGSGIGLHVARKVARLHGGEIAAISEIGRGTIVTLKLPLLSAETVE